MYVRISLMLLVSAVPLSACAHSTRGPGELAPARVRITFVPAAPEFAAAAQAYAAIWREDGNRITRAMEAASGLSFVNAAYADTAIVANVLERPSYSGFRDRPMRLRASYSADTKRATLIHELGHRLQEDLFRRDEDDHPLLFLWIYDVWVDLYGQQFADEQVAIEKARSQRYVDAWNYALGMTRDERADAWRTIRDDRSEPPR